MLVHVVPLGGGFAMVTPVTGVDPGYGIPDWSGARPGQDLPWGPGRPSQGLPWGPGHPSQGLPGSPGHPDNRPPSGPPVTAGPGETVVLVRDQAGVWHYAALPAASPPPRPVPVPPPNLPGQGLPPTAAPKA